MSDIENGQHWLDRNRPPRVQITYDVEIGDAIEKKELPLVVGIMADLDGVGDKIVAEQSFQEIDVDNFNEMLNTIAPSVKVSFARSESMQHAAAEAFTGTFTFTQFDHFEPVALLNMEPTLKKLYEERQQLRDMLARLDGNVKLGRSLDEVFVQERDTAAKVEVKEGEVKDKPKPVDPAIDPDHHADNA